VQTVSSITLVKFSVQVWSLWYSSLWSRNALVLVNLCTVQACRRDLACDRCILVRWWDMLVMLYRRRCHRDHQWCHHTVRATECEHVYISGHSFTEQHCCRVFCNRHVTDKWINWVVTAFLCCHFQDIISLSLFCLWMYCFNLFFKIADSNILHLNLLN